MRTTIGIYDTHENAVQAVKKLQHEGFPANRLSIIGQAKIVDDHIHIRTSHLAEEIEVSIGIIAGSVLGILTGVGVFVIPGFGFLYGAGAVVGAFAGVDIGLIGGGLAAIFTSMGLDEEDAVKYEQHVMEGKFMVVAQGNESELKNARELAEQMGHPMMAAAA